MDQQGGGGGATCAEGRGDCVDAEAVGAVAHRRVAKAEAGSAALLVVWVQVKVSQFTSGITHTRTHRSGN